MSGESIPLSADFWIRVRVEMFTTCLVDLVYPEAAEDIRARAAAAEVSLIVADGRPRATVA